MILTTIDRVAWSWACSIACGNAIVRALEAYQHSGFSDIHGWFDAMMVPGLIAFAIRAWMVR